MTEPRTGALKHALVEGVQADLDDLAARLEDEVAYVSKLEEDTRGIYGLQARCRGWKNALAELVRGIREERDDVSEKLTGAGPDISQTVDAERVATVKEARKNVA